MKAVLNGFAVICPLVFQKAHRLIHVTAKGYSLQTFLGRNTVHQKKTMSDSDMHFGLCLSMDIKDFCLRGAASP